MLYPNVPGIDIEPNEDLISEEKELFIEAKEIFDISPKASGALLRAVLESLLRRVFEDEMPGVKEKTLGAILYMDEVKIKLGENLLEMCEKAKIVGNNASHSAWTIDTKDKKEIIEQMFKLINLIANRLLTVSKEEKQTMEKLKEIR